MERSWKEGGGGKIGRREVKGVVGGEKEGV